ncbi:MAG: beta-lactamase family protein [Planctomycetes bacterium]|nr:beta-lactamase family protein [Planctomycetota bacterium]
MTRRGTAALAALLALLAGGALPAQQPAAAPALPAWTDAATAAIEAAMGTARIPGLSCTIGQDGELVYRRGFGLADVENDVPATSATVYRLGSISKPVTAVLAMQLAERGELDLDRDVHTLVPEWPAKPWPVTTRQLLAHLGGVRHYQGEGESTVHYATQVAGLVRFAGDPLRHEPGTRYLYSTYGYNLVAAVVEKVTAKPFAVLVRERIAVPCAAPTLQDDDVRRLVRGRAQGYIRRDGVLENSELMDNSYKLGGGGLCASADDLARFAQALLAGRLVQPATLAAMWTPQKTTDGQIVDYALGFRIGALGGRRTVHHGGAQARVSTFLLLLPEQRVVVALLCNLEGIRLQALAEQLATAVLAG